MAAVLFIVAWGLIDLRAMRRVWRASRADALTLAVTFVATLTIRLEVAILVGVLVSLLVYLNWATHPQVLRVAPDHESQRRFRRVHPDSPLCPQLDMLRDRRRAVLRIGRAHSRRDRIGARSAPGDTTPAADRHRHQPDRQRRRGAARAPLATSLREAGVELYLCKLRPEVLEAARARRLPRAIGRDHVFATKDQAIAVDLPQARRREVRRLQRAHLHRVPGDAAGRQPARAAAAGTDADAARLIAGRALAGAQTLALHSPCRMSV